jgi:hypothetical protein
VAGAVPTANAGEAAEGCRWMDACARARARGYPATLRSSACLLGLAGEWRCGACVAVAGVATGWSEPKGEAQRLAFARFSFFSPPLSLGFSEKCGKGCHLHCSPFVEMLCC